MKKLILIIFSILTIPVFGQVDYAYYSKSEVEQDLNFAFEKLINIHPIFLDENELILYKKQFSEIKKPIKDSMTQNEVYLLLAPLFASLNDGHTGIVTPINQRIEYTKTGGKSFPFFVDIIDDSIYVSFYCGTDTSLFQNGEQILEINGIIATEMVRNMKPLFPGKVGSIKQKEIAKKFRFLIWMLYGFEDNYELVIKDNQNKIQKKTIPGVTSTEFMENIKRMPKTNQNNFALDIDQRNKIAILKIKSFADLNGFCVFADSAFIKIKESEIQNLVIDIRNNGGGRSIVVDSLMNYLTDQPYAQYKKIEVRISPELKEHYKNRYPDRLDWINSYSIDDFVVLDHNLTQTHNCSLRFNGNLYLLINRSSFSAAATFAGVFKDLQLGTIIGEETGGTISYFGDFWFLITPNSKIKFHVSPKRFIQYGGIKYDRGVIPDYIINDKGDSTINFTRELIKKKLILTFEVEMNTTVIYFSPTETTKKVVTQIATGFGNKNQEYDLTLPSNRDNLKTINFKEEDCVIIGLPVYSGRIPLFMETYLLHMRGNNTPAILTVVYGNRDYDDALLELNDVLKNQGFNIIGACAFIGEHSYTKKVAENRPDQKDLELAHNFGKIINSKLNNINNSNFHQLSIKGNHPYKKRKQSPVYAPITNQNCTDCGICAKNCPMGAIDISDYKTVDAQLCIHCCSCIKKCPVNAKKFDNPIFNKIINFLIENCTTKRKEPEIFF